jgi:hypothetical protein
VAESPETLRRGLHCTNPIVEGQAVLSIGAWSVG